MTKIISTHNDSSKSSETKYKNVIYLSLTYDNVELTLHFAPSVNSKTNCFLKICFKKYIHTNSFKW